MKYIDAERLKVLLSDLKYTHKYYNGDFHDGVVFTVDEIEEIIDSLEQEQSEVDLEKFTERMEDWKARYNHPDNIPIKATMAFTARMFYMYPDIAREWYDGLPKVTQD